MPVHGRRGSQLRTVRQLSVAHRYQRLDAIASGGMGTVYLGRMIAGEIKRPVAIKVLHPHLAGNTEMVAMFRDEARVAKLLRHPNLVGVLDMDVLRDELVIVMEYVEGISLATLLEELAARGEQLPVEVACRILFDALSGLHAAHGLVDEQGRSLGVVHRDVSPHNLLVETSGTTLVTDFGVALAAGRLASTRGGEIKGKLEYLAPEQLNRQVLDRRVDVFAAGIVLWECLTGSRLFEAPTEAEAVARVLHDPIPPPGLSRSEVSTALDEVCLRALERDPERRFATAAEFADALARVGRLADHSEVGALVADVGAKTIRSHRATLEHADEVGFQDESAVLPAHTLPPPRSRRSMIAFVVGSIAAGIVAVRFGLPTREAPPAATPSAVPLASATAAQTPSATPSASVAASGTDVPTSPDDANAQAPAARRDAGARSGPRRGTKGGSQHTFMPDDL